MFRARLRPKPPLLLVHVHALRRVAFSQAPPPDRSERDEQVKEGLALSVSFFLVLILLSRVVAKCVSTWSIRCEAEPGVALFARECVISEMLDGGGGISNSVRRMDRSDRDE